jgi:hypothetical protein
MRTVNLRLLLALMAGFGQVIYLASNAFGQSTPSVPVDTSPTEQSVPSEANTAVQVTQEMLDNAMFQMYFSHVATADQIASKLESDGKDESAFRAHDQREAGLTENEGAIVHQVALDYVKALKDLSTEREAARAAVHDARPVNAVSVNKSTSGESQTSSTARDILNEHISQLQQQLDADSYAKLYKYVKKLFNFHDLGVSVRIDNTTHVSSIKAPPSPDKGGGVR